AEGGAREAAGAEALGVERVDKRRVFGVFVADGPAGGFHGGSVTAGGVRWRCHLTQRHEGHEDTVRWRGPLTRRHGGHRDRGGSMRTHSPRDNIPGAPAARRPNLMR